MKLSKSLLQAMLVGATLGAFASCDLTDPIQDTDVKKEQPSCDKPDSTEKPNENQGYDCPGCGMG